MADEASASFPFAWRPKRSGVRVPDGPAAHAAARILLRTSVMPRAAASLVGLTLALGSGFSPAPQTATQARTSTSSPAAATPPTPAQPQTAADKSVASWMATAAMVADAWLDHKVPRAYALRTLQTAAKRVRAQSTAAGAERRATAVEHLLAAIQQDADGDARRALEELRP